MGEREHLIGIASQAPGYAQDYAAWIERQLALLRNGKLDAVDLSNLIDEVESLGRSDYKGFVSAIEIVLLHLLKWDGQPTHRGSGWIASIVEHRQRIADELEDSPSYNARRDEALARAYRLARPAAARETGLPLTSFPADNPYDWAAVTSRVLQLDA